MYFSLDHLLLGLLILRDVIYSFKAEIFPAAAELKVLKCKSGLRSGCDVLQMSCMETSDVSVVVSLV